MDPDSSRAKTQLAALGCVMIGAPMLVALAVLASGVITILSMT